MKKSIALFLALVCVFTCVFAACSSKKDPEKASESDSTSDVDLSGSGDEIINDFVEVTDKDGEVVTDKDGEAVTKRVVYHKTTDKKGNEYYEQIDDDGKTVTDKNKKPVTKPTSNPATKPGSKPDGNKPDSPTDVEIIDNTTSTTKGTTTTMKPTEHIGTTSPELTTLKLKDDSVPSTSDTGKKVVFSAEDQNIIKDMLEVPYLYCANYENKQGVPIKMAAHVAMWMAQREGLNTKEYASGTIVLDLFKYFAQTVVNFKTDCNSQKDSTSSITYNASNDSFKIDEFETKTHTVTLTSIEYLGNNNYYKVYANVSGVDDVNKVVAVVQKNQIESTLGFSIKALKWSK